MFCVIMTSVNRSLFPRGVGWHLGNACLRAPPTYM